jgi:hypothetical protein
MGATLVMEAAGLSLGFRTAEDFDEGPPDPEPQPGLVARLLLRATRTHASSETSNNSPCDMEGERQRDITGCAGR